jgi:hypothetical protein
MVLFLSAAELGRRLNAAFLADSSHVTLDPLPDFLRHRQVVRGLDHAFHEDASGSFQDIIR